MTTRAQFERASVLLAAKAYAGVLTSDPVMACQLKEHIKPERLVELLELSDKELVDVLRKRGAIVKDYVVV